MDSFMHGMGVVCLAFMLGTAVWTLWSTIVPAWRQMLAAFRGQPRSPATSVEPYSTASTPLRRVEADAEPTLSVTA